MKNNKSFLVICLATLFMHEKAFTQPQIADAKRKPNYTALALADMPDLIPSQMNPVLPSVQPQKMPDSLQSAELLAAKAQKKMLSPVPAAKRQEGEPRFDLSVSNAPAEQVFIQLGAGTSYNVLVSPGIAGFVSVQLKNVTVPEVMEVLRDLYGYEYKIQNKRILVYANTVQTRIFKINYLPGRRQGTSDLQVSSNSVASTTSTSSSGGESNKSGGSSSGGTNNSSKVSTSSDADFWNDLKNSLQSIISTDGGRSININANAGIILVRATPAEHRDVAAFLKDITVSIERQVMLEAKIIEVALSSGSQTGVNWTLFKGAAGDNLAMGGVVGPGINLNNSSIRSGADQITPGVSINTDSAGKGFYGLAIQATNFTALINFLESQGNVQVLSSPRIATINSQKAILKVGADEFFVTGLKTDVTAGTNGGAPLVSPTITVQPFFSGISLDVTPQIDEDGTIILHVHPAVSNVSTKNKVVDLGDLGQYKLPLASSSISETDSIVRVKHGQIVAIGGLMSEVKSTDKQGVKGFSRLPVIGEFLFGQKDELSSKRELVILIKPTLIDADGDDWKNESQLSKTYSSIR